MVYGIVVPGYHPPVLAMLISPKWRPYDKRDPPICTLRTLRTLRRSVIYHPAKFTHDDSIELQNCSLPMAVLEHQSEVSTDAQDRVRSDRGSATITTPVELSSFRDSSFPLLR